MQSSPSGTQQQKIDVKRYKELLEEAATSLAESNDALERELAQTREHLAAAQHSNKVLQEQLGAARQELANAKGSPQQNGRSSVSAIEVLKGDKLIAAADAAADVAALKKHIDRERLTAVQEVEAQWKARYENFKRESVLILANKSTALETAEGQVKHLKKRLAAAEASLSKEVSSKTKALEEQAVAAEARAAQLEAEAAAHQQRAERAQQEARFTAAQLEQQRERLAIALAARDRADAECAAAKAERAAAERDREAADKVLDEFVTRINELEQQQQDNPLPLAHLDAHAHAPPTPAAPAPAGAAPGPVPAAAEPAAEEAAKGDGPMDADGWAGADATAAAAPPARPSRDPRMAARSSRGALELPPWVATGGPSADHGSTLHPPPCPPSATEGHHLDADDPAPSPLLEAPHAAVAQSPALEQEITDFFPTNCATATGHPPPDARCWLCHKSGTQRYQDLGELLHLPIDKKGTDFKWLHCQCLLWSPEVSEGRSGELLNVPKAVTRGRKINCKVCSGNGATLGCSVKSCRSSYHLHCALDKGCHLDDWRLWCPKHAPRGMSSVVADDTDQDRDGRDYDMGDDERDQDQGASRQHVRSDPASAAARVKVPQRATQLRRAPEQRHGARSSAAADPAAPVEDAAQRQRRKRSAAPAAPREDGAHGHPIEPGQAPALARADGQAPAHGTAGSAAAAAADADMPACRRPRTAARKGHTPEPATAQLGAPGRKRQRQPLPAELLQQGPARDAVHPPRQPATSGAAPAPACPRAPRQPVTAAAGQAAWSRLAPKAAGPLASLLAARGRPDSNSNSSAGASTARKPSPAGGALQPLLGPFNDQVNDEAAVEQRPSE